MQISPGLGLAIMFNNYFHDVATGLVIATAFTLHVVIRIREAMPTHEATLFFLAAYDRLVKLFRFAIWWVLLAGVPRTVFYTSFEWANAVDKLQVPAIILKHIIMAALLVWGVIAWKRLKKKVAALKASLPA